MKETIYNEDNLTIDNIDEKEIRTKILMINHKNQILMGYYKKTYQFIGGHLKEGETLEQCLQREIKEETGITIDTSKFKPFYVIRYFNKNYHNTGKNILSEIYYYEIIIDESYHIDLTNYDKEEIEGNYELRYINLDEFDDVMIHGVSDEDELNGIIIRDNINIMKYYKMMKDLSNK